MKKSNPFFNKTYAIEKFEEPWHAQLFALTINLNDSQIFSWSEWVAVFSRNLNGVEKCNESKTGYFEIWLDSLEEILLEKKKIHTENLKEVLDGWVSAYNFTPHGKPVRFSKKINLL